MAKKIQIKGAIVSNDDKWIYDWYGMESTCPKDVEKTLSELKGQHIEVEINSGGGDIFAGSEIYSLLRQQNSNMVIYVLGLAGSAASIIAMAGKCLISPTAMMMIHNVSCNARGDYHTMQDTSVILQKANKAMAAAYVAKTGKSEVEALELMDKETWFTADEALQHGLVDGKMFENNISLVASFEGGLIPLEIINKMKAERFQNTLLERKTNLENKLKKLGGMQ